MTILPYPKKISIKTTLPKKHIIWHGTFNRTKYTPYGTRAIKPTALLDQWELSKEKFGAPYLIDRDGTIYKTYDDSDWSYHLNLPNTKGFFDKQSIPIMLANELHLLRENGQFFAFEYPHSTNTYLGPVIVNNWKEYKYWAKLDDAQVDAALELTLDICKRHNIDPIFYVGKKSNSSLLDKATILTHSAINPSVTDFPPFDDYLIAKIKEKGIKIISD